MKAVVQRVSRASVRIDDRQIASIGRGFLVLLGIGELDEPQTAQKLAGKTINLRVMADEQNKMNLSLKDVEGEILVVSQFTLYADTSGGNRPSFTNAAMPEKAENLYNQFLKYLKDSSLRVQSGEFGAIMDITLVNTGPVTILLET